MPKDEPPFNPAPLPDRALSQLLWGGFMMLLGVAAGVITFFGVAEPSLRLNELRTLLGFLALFLTVFPLSLLIKGVARYLRFGGTTLEPRAPGRLGGTFQGAIRCRRALANCRRVEIVLSCLSEVTVRGAKNTTYTVQRPVWSNGYDLKPGADPVLPVWFALPRNQPATSGPRGNRTVWMIHLHAWRRGPDLVASWEIPVPSFEEGSTPPAMPAEFAALLEDPAGLLERVGIRREGARWLFPGTRDYAAHAVFNLLVAAVMLPLFIAQPELGLIWAWFALFAAAAWDVAHRRYEKTEIALENGRLRWRTGLPALSRRHSLPLSQVESIDAEKAYSDHGQIYFHLYARRPQGLKRLPLKESVEGNQLAHRLWQDLNAELQRQKGMSAPT
jgi:hypothetical protein